MAMKYVRGKLEGLILALAGRLVKAELVLGDVKLLV